MTMPDKHVVTCSVCGEEGAASFYVVDRILDAAGSPDDEIERVDLCPDHTILALRRFLKTLSHEQAREWFNKWKGEEEE
jgi:hypothetical protein